MFTVRYAKEHPRHRGPCRDPSRAEGTTVHGFFGFLLSYICGNREVRGPHRSPQ